MNKQNKQPIDTEKQIIARGLGSGGMGKRLRGFRIQTQSCNINKSQECKEQHRECHYYHNNFVL